MHLRSEFKTTRPRTRLMEHVDRRPGIGSPYCDAGKIGSAAAERQVFTRTLTEELHVNSMPIVGRVVFQASLSTRGPLVGFSAAPQQAVGGGVGFSREVEGQTVMQPGETDVVILPVERTHPARVLCSSDGLETGRAPGHFETFAAN